MSSSCSSLSTSVFGRRRYRSEAAHRVASKSSGSKTDADRIGATIIATLHLMVGLPCSGKTTLAKQIEHTRSALRLTPDEWIARLYGIDAPLATLDAARDPMEALLWDVAARALVLGVDVILDFGFWSRTERDEFRRRAAELGADSELHFIDVPAAELLGRLADRNAARPPDTFFIDEARLRLWLKVFEPPTAQELAR